jgi:hydroxysqualene dehydroxylase
MEDRAPERLTIPIIGGGWAGCAAALALVEKGCRVALYEIGHTLGGRARRVVRDGLSLDNGQHILLGAYVEARRAIAAANGDPTTSRLMQRPLAIAPFAPTQPGAFAFRARRLPPPWGLLAGLLSAHGLPWRERTATARWFAHLRKRAYRVDEGETAAEMLATAPSLARERLLNPLCISALNTSPSRASARVFANVLRVAFDGANEASDMLLPSTDLATVFPDGVARMLARGGHAIHLRSEATLVENRDRDVRLRIDESDIRAPAAIVAVAPHQLARVFAPRLTATTAIRQALDQVARLEWEPIVTVYLGYTSRIDLPVALVQLDGAPGQWVFDRHDMLARAQSGGPALAALLAVVISARGDHDALGNDALTAVVDAQLRRLRPSLPRPAWSQVIAERRATYSCTPHALRPRAGRLAAGIYLAGDYTDHEFPATLEAAVRSGQVAAEAVVRDLSN